MSDDDGTANWSEERWAAYRAEAEAYFDALDYGRSFEARHHRQPFEMPVPLPAARVVGKRIRDRVAALCRRLLDRGD